MAARSRIGPSVRARISARCLDTEHSLNLQILASLHLPQRSSVAAVVKEGVAHHPLLTSTPASVVKHNVYNKSS